MTKRCPSCGGVMEKCETPIHFPVMNTLRGATETKYAARLAVFFACTACEHYEEK